MYWQCQILEETFFHKELIGMIVNPYKEFLWIHEIRCIHHRVIKEHHGQVTCDKYI